MRTRISQLTFSSDGELLVISAEAGGGLAFYETQALLNGTTQTAFELPTGGNSVRSLVANPAPEAAGLFAVVTVNGQLMMLDAKNRSFINGANGQILKEGVSCISWSSKGKQLVVGLGNGAATQLTPEGVVKAEIPRPPDLESGHHGEIALLFRSASSNLYSVFFDVAGERSIPGRLYPQRNS